MGTQKDTSASFFKLAIPNILSNLTIPLAGLVDTAMLGHLDDIVYLAGVSLGSILFDYLYWMFGFLRMSTTGLTAQADGAGRKKDLYLIPARGLILALMCGLLILFLKHPIGNLGFSLLEGSAEVKQEGLKYFMARVWGAPVVLGNFVLTGWFLGRGKGKTILILSMLANGCNIFLDYILIYHLQMGSQGAGMATMISQYVMFLSGCYILYPFFIKNRRGLTRKALFESKAIKSLLGLNRDILIRTFLLISSFSYFINISAEIGVLCLVANSILLKVISIGSFFIDGLAFAIESFAGRLKGRNEGETLTGVIHLALWSAAATGLFFAALFNLFPNQLFFILTSQQQVLDVIASYRIWLFPVMLLGSAAYIWDGVFLGLSRGHALRNCMILSAATFFPTAYWAGRIQNIHLLWFSMALFMFIRTLTLSNSMPDLKS